MNSREFKQVLRNFINPYGGGNTSSKIVGTLKNFAIKGVLRKAFFDRFQSDRGES